MKILTDPRSGSYQGITSSRNRFGQYVRTRAIPVQPRTPKQTQNRAQLTTASNAWRQLTDPQRTAWNDYAAQIGRSDSLGSSYFPTGAALFTGANIAGQAAGTNLDAPLTLPIYVLAILSMAYVDPSPGPEALTLSIATTSTANLILAETSGPISPGITSAGAVRRWRSLPATAGNLNPAQLDMTTSSVSLLTEYKFLFPSPVAGQVIWWRFREIFIDDTNFSAIVNNNFQTFRQVIT